MQRKLINYLFLKNYLNFALVVSCHTPDIGWRYTERMF